jgi:hypothetical protein
MDDLITDLFRLVRPIRVFAALQQHSGPYAGILDQIRKIDSNDFSLPASPTSSVSAASAIVVDTKPSAPAKIEVPSGEQPDTKDDVAFDPARGPTVIATENQGSIKHTEDPAIVTKPSFSAANITSPESPIEVLTDTHKIGPFVLTLGASILVSPNFQC